MQLLLRLPPQVAVDVQVPLNEIGREASDVGGVDLRYLALQKRLADVECPLLEVTVADVAGNRDLEDVPDLVFDVKLRLRIGGQVLRHREDRQRDAGSAK